MKDYSDYMDSDDLAHTEPTLGSFLVLPFSIIKEIIIWILLILLALTV